MDTEIEKTMGILTDLLHARAYDENYPTDSDLKEAIKELREIVASVKAKDDEINMLKKLVNNLNNTYSVGDFDFEAYYTTMLKDDK